MLYTTADAARRLNLTPAAVRALSNRGQLKATRTYSGVRLFDSDDVERLAEERRANASANGQDDDC